MWSDCSTKKTDFFLNLLICVFVSSSPCSGLGFKGKVLSLSQGGHSTAPPEARGCSSLLEILTCFFRFLVYGPAVLFCVFPIWFYLRLVDPLALFLDSCVFLLPMHPPWFCDHQFQSLARWNVLRTWRFLLDRICHYMTIAENSQITLAHESMFWKDCLESSCKSVTVTTLLYHAFFHCLSTLGFPAKLLDYLTHFYLFFSF